jgi:predicted deacylase
MFIILVVILLLVIFLVYQSACNNIETYIFTSNTDGPTVLLIGGTHGNEPAGSVALLELVSNLELTGIKSGKLIIVPQVNKCGLSLGIRFQPQNLLTLGLTGSIDLNRSYSEESPGCPIATQLNSVVSKADWVMDLHEGWGYHKENPMSMGSGVYYGKTEESEKVAEEITDNLNKEIPYPNKQFVCKRWEEQPGTLRSLCDTKGVNYILVETTGQGNVQPLDVRSEQHLKLVTELLKKLNLI